MRESTRSVDSIDEVGLRETTGRCAIHLLQNNGLRAAAARFWLGYYGRGDNRGASAWPSRNLTGKGTEGSARR